MLLNFHSIKLTMSVIFIWNLFSESFHIAFRFKCSSACHSSKWKFIALIVSLDTCLLGVVDPASIVVEVNHLG